MLRNLPQSDRAKPPRAFSLVELLVVVSIIGAMLSLILPAIQNARESARRVHCKNNLKQLSIACFSHHDVHRWFPTGGWGWFWTGDSDRGFGKEQPGGWIFNTLPYYEQYALYDSSSDGEPEILTRKQRLGAAEIIQTPLAIVNCPSRRPNHLYPMTANQGGDLGYHNSITPDAAGRSDYAINSGHVYNEWPISDLGRGPRNYLEARHWSAMGYWGVDQAPFYELSSTVEVMTGVSFERSTISMRQVSAGLSHTYLVGEKHIPQAHYDSGLDNGDNETWCTGFNNDNYRRTGRLHYGEIVESVPIPDSAIDVPDHTARFGSAHTNVWNVSYCDGSVQEMTFDIDWKVHLGKGNRLAK